MYETETVRERNPETASDPTTPKINVQSTRIGSLLNKPKRDEEIAKG